jgi:hypothetical protein
MTYLSNDPKTGEGWMQIDFEVLHPANEIFQLLEYVIIRADLRNKKVLSTYVAERFCLACWKYRTFVATLEQDAIGREVFMKFCVEGQHEGIPETIRNSFARQSLLPWGKQGETMIYEPHARVKFWRIRMLGEDFWMFMRFWMTELMIRMEEATRPHPDDPESI